MGGLPINWKGEVLIYQNDKDTVIPVSNTHGANRLRANSILDVVVFGKSLAATIARKSKPGDKQNTLKDNICDALDNYHNLKNASGCAPPDKLREAMRHTMQNKCGVFRNANLLADVVIQKWFKAFEDIRVVDKSTNWNTDFLEVLELQNMLQAAVQVVACAENRTESRGAHFRDDFPNRIGEFDYSKPIEGQRVGRLSNALRSQLPLKTSFRKNSFTIHQHVYDCVIIGGGGAGLRAAIGLAEAKFSVALVSKLFPTRSHTTAAQGGMNAALGSMHPDNWKFHFYDTVKGSDWLGDQDSIHYLTREAPTCVMELENMGMPFSRTKDGKIYQRPFGGGTVNFGKSTAKRTCAVADRTGHSLLHTLYGYSTKYKNITYFSEFFVMDLLLQDNEVVGCLAIDMDDGSLHRFQANNTIMTTGGYPRMYFSCTAAHTCTGDGVAMATRCGIPLQDMEFVQFHPTGMYGSGCLMTEGSRGEGGYLVNSEGVRFMEKYAPKAKDLASRDVVSRSMATEIRQGRGVGPRKDHVYLQLHHLPAALIKERLPGISESALTFTGADIYTQPVPVLPTVHYTMGGLPINWKGEVLIYHNDQDTVIPGFYAAGEVVSNAHGANRLGANSILDVVVFGKSLATTIAKKSKPGDKQKDLKHNICDASLDNYHNLKNASGCAPPHELREAMRHTMQNKCGVFRDAKLLGEADDEIQKWYRAFQDIRVVDKRTNWNTDFLEVLELQNMLQAAVQVVACAKNRTESRGAHFRDDFPNRIDEFDYSKPIEGQTKKSFENHWRKHSITTIDLCSGQVSITYRPVIDKTMDENEVKWIPPVPRVY